MGEALGTRSKVVGGGGEDRVKGLLEAWIVVQELLQLAFVVSMEIRSPGFEDTCMNVQYSPSKMKEQTNLM